MTFQTVTLLDDISGLCQNTRIVCCFKTSESDGSKWQHTSSISINSDRAETHRTAKIVISSEWQTNAIVFLALSVHELKRKTNRLKFMEWNPIPFTFLLFNHESFLLSSSECFLGDFQILLIDKKKGSRRT